MLKKKERSLFNKKKERSLAVTREKIHWKGISSH
jgi:hypothetical protein